MSNYKEKLNKITTFVFDYDGVLTNGTVLITDTGEQLRTGLVKDGYALHIASKKGYKIAIISGGTSDSIRQRCLSLHIEDVFLCVSDKLDTLKQYMKTHNLHPDEIAFMGDDIPDYPLMQKVGLSSCPADAAVEIKNVATYISMYNGGHGCVRDLIEQVMKVQGKWMNDDAYIW